MVVSMQRPSTGDTLVYIYIYILVLLKVLKLAFPGDQDPTQWIISKFL